MNETLNPSLLLAIPLLPLAAAVVSGLFCSVLPRWVAHTLTIAGVAISFGMSAHVAGSIFFHDAQTFNDTVYRWLVSDGTGRPYKVHLRPPGFAILSGVSRMIEGRMLADLIPTFDTINMIGGEVEQ